MKKTHILLTLVIAAALFLAWAGGGKGSTPIRQYLPAIHAGNGPAYPFPYPEPATPTPIPTVSPTATLAPFAIREVWTAGGDFTRLALFHPGESVLLFVEFFSPADVEGLDGWAVDSPCGRLLDARTPATFSAGVWRVYNEIRIPPDACPGGYVFRYTADLGPGREYQAEAQFTVEEK